MIKIKKNKTFLDSVKCALKGFHYGIKTEKNFRIYFIIGIVTLIINLMLGIRPLYIFILMIPYWGAMSSEALNTAIEHICDKETKERDEGIRIIKDLGAAGVICWGFIYFFFEFIVILDVYLCFL